MLRFKECRVCTITRPIQAFPKLIDSPDGRSYICKFCSDTVSGPTIESKFNSYLRSAARRKMLFKLTLEEFSSFWQRPCSYCGQDIKTIGLDRIDSKLGYILDNVVPCCGTCNIMKGSLSRKTFLDKVAEIYLYYTPIKS